MGDQFRRDSREREPQPNLHAAHHTERDDATEPVQSPAGREHKHEPTNHQAGQLEQSARSLARDDDHRHGLERLYGHGQAVEQASKNLSAAKSDEHPRTIEASREQDPDDDRERSSDITKRPGKFSPVKLQPVYHVKTQDVGRVSCGRKPAM